MKPRFIMSSTTMLCVRLCLIVAIMGVPLFSRAHAAPSLLGGTESLKSVSIDGPSNGDLNKPYTFTALVVPKDLTDLKIEWAPEPQQGQGTTTAQFIWPQIGKKIVKVSVTDISGAAVETEHVIDIAQPGVVNGASLNASPNAAVLVDTPLSVSIDLSPTTASPSEIRWLPDPVSGQGKRETTFQWSQPGSYTVQAIVINEDASRVVASLAVTVSDQATATATPTPSPQPEETATPQTSPTPNPTDSAVSLFLPLVSANETVQSASIDETDIVGGVEADVGEWPWQAALMLTANFTGRPGLSQFCGGSLIAPNWVLTAAHCLPGLNTADLVVVLGRHRLSASDGEVIGVRRIISHPGYNDNTNDKDIALLELVSPSSQTPVSLGTPTFGTGDLVTVTGWGTTISGDSSSGPDALREVTVPMVDRASCNQSYNGQITENMICAGVTGKDSCQGDSGGPLVLPVGQQWIQVGVVSWGIGCAAAGFPGVYTNMAIFQDWIQSNVQTGDVPGDSFEPDNSSAEAGTIATTGAAQSHTFHISGDQDWVKFTATSGTRYIIKTANLRGDADTILTLYGTDGTSSLAENDDSNNSRASQIDWTAPTAGTYFVNVRELNNRGGASVGYALSITGETTGGGEQPGDTFEPDNAAAQASAIGTNGVAQTHTIHEAGDVDWVSFSATAGTAYSITTSSLLGGADTILELYSPDGATVIERNDDVADGIRSSQIIWIATTTDTYLVRVRDYDSSIGNENVAYDLAISNGSSNGGGEPIDGDTFEEDNSPQTASAIPTNGTSQTHSFHVPGDVDWISFVAESGVLYTIETSNLQNGADTILALYAPNGTDLLDTNDDIVSGNLASRIEWTATTDGTYLIKVRHYNEAVGSANVLYNVAITGDTDSSSTDGDAFEPDNSAGSASTLATDGTIQIHSFHVEGDIDWVQFSATAGVKYMIDTSNLRGGTDTFIKLYSTDGTTLVTQNDDYNGYASHIEWTASESGTYFVEVSDFYSFGGPNAGYDLAITSQVGQGGDLYESDDSPEQAEPITPDGAPQSHTFHVAGDPDWIRFAAVAGSEYVIETYNLTGDADTVMALYAADGSWIVADDDSGSGYASRIQWEAPANGEYYVRIEEYSGRFGTAGYDVTVSLLDSGSAATKDDYEVDDTPAQASAISADGSAQRHTFHAPGDQDWLALDATAGQRYLLETSNLRGDADTVVGIYDVDGATLLDFNDDNANGETRASLLEWTAPVDGTYYILVVDYSSERGGEGIGYDIRVSSGAASDLINGDFEEGDLGWIERSDNDFQLILSDATELVLPIPAFSGSWAVWLGGAIDEVSYILQENVYVPIDSPYLTYYEWIVSGDFCGYDWGGVAINGEWYEAYELCSETATGGWALRQIDLSPYAGQAVDLYILASNDSSEHSNFYIDSIAFDSAQSAAARKAEIVQSANVEAPTRLKSGVQSNVQPEVEKSTVPGFAPTGRID